MSNTYIKAGLALILIWLMLSLSISSFSVYSTLRAELKAQSNIDTATNSAKSQRLIIAPSDLLSRQQILELEQLDSRTLELEKNLEFMVWPEERLKLQQRLLANLKQKINLTPLDGRDWLILLSHLFQTRAPIEEQHWALKHALSLNVWSSETRPLLAHYCINSQTRVTGSLRAECLQLFRNLPWQENKPVLARLIGISSELLEAVLTEARATGPSIEHSIDGAALNSNRAEKVF